MSEPIIPVPTETDEQRDARFAPMNDERWGAGNWVRCGCAHDSHGREVYHHRNAHAVVARPAEPERTARWCRVHERPYGECELDPGVLSLHDCRVLTRSVGAEVERG